MSCDCKKNIEEKYTELVKKQLPESEDHKVRLMGFALVVDSTNTMRSKGCMSVEITHTVTVKKTGAQKTKKDKGNMLFTFCPFCGERYEPKQDQE